MAERTTDQWYEDGLSLLDSGFFDSTIRCFDEVLQARPRDAGAWSLKATALAGLERNEEAIECFDIALAIDPRNARAWKGKALCLTRVGREEEAAQCEAEAIRIAGVAKAPLPPVKEPAFMTCSVADGLASNTVHRIAADEKEAWFVYGKDGGATRLTLNDAQLRNYTQDDGLTSNVVRCVALGKKDVWLGTDRGLSRFDRETQDWTASTPETVLEAGLINELAIDGQLLWLGTDSGLLVLDVVSGRLVLCEGGPNPAEVDCLLADGRRIWCGANREDGGVSVFDKHTGIFHKLDVGPFVQGLTLFPLDGENRVWVATEQGIAVVTRTGYELEEVSLPAMLVTAIAAGVQGLLAGTARGLAKVDTKGSGAEREIVVTRTEIGRGKYVTDVHASRTREWIGIKGEGVLCLSYSP